MKNNELRIGNYVQHNGEIIKVEQITKHKIGYHKYSDKHTMQYLRYSEIEPVEITEDLLLEHVLVTIYFNMRTINKNIKYIHELQNAYYVCNNKELKLKF
jgi:hypothetical protein